MKKSEAQALFDRLDEAGLGVNLRKRVERVDIRTWESAGPEYARGAERYEVEVEIESLIEPEHLRLIADQIERHKATLRSQVGVLIIS